MSRQADQAGIVVRMHGRDAAFQADEVTVGRDPACSVPIDDKRLARVHLVLRRLDGSWVADARGRSFLDGRPVRLLELRAATTLTLGHPVDGVAVELEPLESVSREQTLPPGKLSGVLDLGAGFAEERARTRETATGLPQLRTVTIGRDSSNLVSVKDLLVSRHHAEVRPTEGGRLELVDLESSNGTFVNGRRVARALLDDLDVITVGRHSFRLVGAQLEKYVDEGLVSFQARGLTVLAADGRPLLEDISFSLDERSFLAVVGPSGAGKSLLLSALTGFRPADRGAVLYGGRDLYMDYDALRTRIAFVPQDDVVHHPLTVRQALSYAAELRFSSDVGREDRETRVTEVIEELGLGALVDARVARLSGGERRRVCVGLELITRPSLLFLDEPTTGLDPGYERSLMRLFRDLANDGRTVVVVTHSVQSLRLCDRVLFLAPGGRTAYFGPAQLAPAYFERDDFQEVFHDLSTEKRDWAGRFSEHRLHRQYVEQRLSEDAPHVTPDARPRRLSNPRSWFAQAWLLTRRYARVVTSDRRNVALLLLQPVVLGLIMLAALPAHELGPPPDGELRLASRAGLVLLVLVLGATWLGASNSIREIVKERAVFRHERAAGQHVSAYVTSKVLVLGVITLVQAAILVPLATARQGGPEQGSLLPWPLVELVLGAGLAGLAAMGLGLFISSIAGSVDRAITILPVVLIVQMLLAMGGVFPDVVDKPGLEQASKLAGTQWGFAATASTVELDRLQTVDRLAEEMSTLDTSDPLPFLRALSSQAQSEPRWSHDWETWVWDAVRLLLLTVAGIAGATLVLRRRDVST